MGTGSSCRAVSRADVAGKPVTDAERQEKVAAWRGVAEHHRHTGERLWVTVAEYGELVRLKLASDPLRIEDHTSDLFGVPMDVVT